MKKNKVDKNTLVRKHGKKKPRYPLRSTLRDIAQKVSSVCFRYKFLRSQTLTKQNILLKEDVERIVLLDENQIKPGDIKLNALDFRTIANWLQEKKISLDQFNDQVFYFSENILTDDYFTQKVESRNSVVENKSRKRIRTHKGPDTKHYVLCFEQHQQFKNTWLPKVHTITWVKYSKSPKYKIICMR